MPDAGLAIKRKSRRSVAPQLLSVITNLSDSHLPLQGRESCNTGRGEGRIVKSTYCTGCVTTQSSRGYMLAVGFATST